MFLNNKSANDGSGISNLIASHFKSVYKNDPTSPLPPEFYLLEEDNILLSNLVITDAEVLQQIKILKLKNSSGPDGVPSRLIYNCMFTLLEPLKILFNKSLISGYFPVAWKTVFITPIHKSGD